MRAQAIVLALLISSTLLATVEARPADEASGFRMEGQVTEEGTGQPVADATVQVLIESEHDIESRLRTAKTDANGRYSVALPVGHAWSFGLYPPAGYVPASFDYLEMFATTRDKPVFHKDFVVRRGTVWKIELHAPAAAFPLAKTLVSGGRQQGINYLSNHSELARDGTGVLTLPDVGGEFDIRCGDFEYRLLAPERMKLQWEKGFQSDRVSAVKEIDGGYELRDAEGHTATASGLKVEKAGEAAKLVIDARLRQGADYGTIVGRLVDSHDQPIAGGRVVPAFYEGQGSATSHLHSQSGADGKFRLEIPKRNAAMKVSLVVTKDGYGGHDTEPRTIDFAQDPTVDFGEIKLTTASTIAIRVVGPDEQPLEGAVVEPQGSYAARAAITRTDENGKCVLKNLAPGLQPVHAKLGKLTTSTKLPLVEGDNELLVLKLHLPRTAAAQPEERPAVKLKAGDQAPEWQVTKWLDGQPRKLSDYRGKVVVLDFWGIWCGPCINSIPAMKELHEKYKDRGVVFIAIHTAGTDLSLIERLLKQQQWETLAGLDQGDDINSGATVQAFGIRGFPTVIVVGPDGKVAYRSDEFEGDEAAIMKEIEEFAKSIGLPWPLDKDASQEEILERLKRLNVALHSREIDRALASPPRP
jgi:thiol-disulfide isomerase/thioredoxin/5-hydroxyisourate hydrolase-like protein (transthyretin family)